MAWREIAKDGYPSIEEYGPYPTVMVALACKGQPDWPYRIQYGVLWFFGGDKSRPYWTGPEKTSGPIENPAWHVTHWAPALEPPLGGGPENG